MNKLLLYTGVLIAAGGCACSPTHKAALLAADAKCTEYAKIIIATRSCVSFSNCEVSIAAIERALSAATLAQAECGWTPTPPPPPTPEPTPHIPQSKSKPQASI